MELGQRIMSQKLGVLKSATKPSSKSTKQGLEPSTSSSLISHLKDKGPSAESAAVLESRLEEERAQRKIERFFWIMAITILFDCILFKLLASPFPEGFVALLSLILIIGCAQWLEVPYVSHYLDRAFNHFLVKKGAARGTEKEEA
jgi:hypothetical protein